MLGSSEGRFGKFTSQGEDEFSLGRKMDASETLVIIWLSDHYAVYLNIYAELNVLYISIVPQKGGKKCGVECLQTTASQRTE